MYFNIPRGGRDPARSARRSGRNVYVARTRLRYKYLLRKQSPSHVARIRFNLQLGGVATVKRNAARTSLNGKRLLRDNVPKGYIARTSRQRKIFARRIGYDRPSGGNNDPDIPLAGNV